MTAQAIKAFDPARARETARRLREGEPAAPLFRSEAKPGPNANVVISSIGAHQCQ